MLLDAKVLGVSTEEVQGQCHHYHYGLIGSMSLWTLRKGMKKSDTHRDTAACWAAVSLWVPATNERKKGRRSRICSSGSLPYLLSLSGFYLANGGLHAGWCEASLKPRCTVQTVCLCVGVFEPVLILWSSVIVPYPGLLMPAGQLFFLFFFCGTHTQTGNQGWLIQQLREERQYRLSTWVVV